MLDEPLDVKGSTILSKLVFVRDRFGAEAEQDLHVFLKSHAQSPQILAGSWYPFSLYEALLQQIAERHFGGELSRLREVGEDSAHRALTGTYEVYGQMGLRHFLARIGALHKRLYSRGEIVAAMAEEGDSCTIRMLGASLHTAADLELAAGFYAGAAHELGLQEVSCDYVRVGSEVHFQLRWAPGTA